MLALIINVVYYVMSALGAGPGPALLTSERPWG